MKNIYNPTENGVSITIKGINYSLEAGGSENVGDDVAEKWFATHQFLQIKDAEVVVEKKEEKKEEVKEEEKVSGDKPRDIPKKEEKESLIKRAAKAVTSKK